MIRAHYFNYIEEKLAILATRIELRGKLNILDLHLHSENFYLHFLNKLFSWQLENLNVVKHNVAAIDLIAKERKIVVQISATATKQKIESALTKDLSGYSEYAFKFISISKDASGLRKQTYDNPHNLDFSPRQDIFDNTSILKIINALDIDRLQNIHAFIKQELGKNIDQSGIETNLAKIINILAKEDWDLSDENSGTEAFEIDRKIEYNELDSAKLIIEDYAANSNRVEKIYTEFNKSGVNKSASVLASIRKMYAISKDSESGDALFFDVVEQVLERVQSSVNYTPIPFDELEICVNILVVDAFIRCKIFKNPKGAAHVTA